ncbi:MAG: RNA polymerase sigma factor [Bacteroidales bacterium]|nr:RNA polymerase sigma factor [Bacteroidales bacterium]MDE7071846.1 RNA polymerase sigma factor [Bacteroidales bacterium]
MTEREDDRRLVESILTVSDQVASSRLVNKYHEPLLQFITGRIGNETEAEDLLQETFAKVFNGLHTFNPRYAFSTWIYNIADHSCIDYLRKTGRTNGLEKTASLQEGSLAVCFPEENGDSEMEHCVENPRELMDLLPQKYQKVFALRYLESKKYRQIAEEACLPMGTVKTYLFRAKAVLNAKAKKSDREDA